MCAHPEHRAATNVVLTTSPAVGHNSGDPKIVWRGFLLIFFIFGALAHSWAQPYNTMYENWLELFSILFLIVVLHLNPDGSEPGWSWFVIILVLVMIIVFIFVMRKVKGKESEELEVLARDDLDVRMLDAGLVR